MLPDFLVFLEKNVKKFNHPDFIGDDPISVPHLFSDKQNIEVIGFWMAMLSWGQRKTILAKGKELIDLMDGNPIQFILDHKEKDRLRFENFKHRTFNFTDTLYFLEFFQQYYRSNNSLETAFSRFLPQNAEHVGPALAGFHNFFFSLDNAPHRTKKHVSTPLSNSTCKRLNMFLRWMVRKDENGVDFGIWQKIRPAQLLIPLDVHVNKVARQWKLLQRPQMDWKAVLELTDNLKKFDPNDPVKYDFALFGWSVSKQSLDHWFS